MKLQELETWVTPRQAADRIGISKQALHQHLKDGRFRAVNTQQGWLIDPASVEEFASQRQKRQREATTTKGQQ